MIGYCPSCGSELSIYAKAANGDIVWSPCRNRRCMLKGINIITDPHGFCIDPSIVKTKYIFKKPKRKKRK